MRAHVMKANCIDEFCSIHGKDVREILRGNEPSWVNEVKVVGFFIVAAAFVLMSKFALYMYE